MVDLSDDICHPANNFNSNLLFSCQVKDNAEAAIQDFSSIIRLSPDKPDGWIKRAEVLSTYLSKQFIALSKHVFPFTFATRQGFLQM